MRILHLLARIDKPLLPERGAIFFEDELFQLLGGRIRKYVHCNRLASIGLDKHLEWPVPPLSRDPHGRIEIDRLSAVTVQS